MPMSDAFRERLFPRLERISSHFGTPFHIYDEAGIRDTGAGLISAFSGIPGFREYFAVKALPNPRILGIMKDAGFGFDCSSVTELLLARRVGAAPEDIMFTSNNTSSEDFELALADGGCILNLDDISLIEKTPLMPDLICFRYNPGERRTGNEIIGNPVESKYGVSHDQLIDAYRLARERGASRFGLHTMLASNELDLDSLVDTAAMLLDLAAEVEEALGIRFEFLNTGGGIGIPYRPGQGGVDIAEMGRRITGLFREFERSRGYIPRLYMESGRYMTGPSGVLVTRAINRKDIYRTYIGVDACMTALMRPGMYGAYHHIEVPFANGRPGEMVDVVGSLCENNDKFAVERWLPEIRDDDLLVIQDTGAHGHSMGFNYNGKLRPAELLLTADGNAELIRRAETPEDYFATLDFPADSLPGDAAARPAPDLMGG